MSPYGCKAWTYNQEIEEKVNACETWCYRRMLGVKLTDKRTKILVSKCIVQRGEVLCESLVRRGEVWRGGVNCGEERSIVVKRGRLR